MAVSGIITEGLGQTAGGGGGGGLFQISSIVPATTSIAINLNANVTLASLASLASNWTISATTGIPMTVTAINASGPTITLTVTQGTSGSIYTINIPNGVIRTSDSAPLAPPYNQNFTATGVAPTVTSITRSDARRFEVIFSTNMLESEALTKANYVVAPPLTVSGVTKIQGNTYQVSTSEAQVPGQSYMVTVSNVHDLFGNLI